MADRRQLDALARAHTTASATVRARVLTFLDRAWGGLRDYRDSEVDAFAAAVVPVVAAGQRQVSSLTDAYLTRRLSMVLGRPVRPAAFTAARLTGIRGTPPAEVYRRPFVAVWTALSQGKVDLAVRMGAQRLASLASTDLQLARTHTARAVFSRADGVSGYRRVLTGSSSCGLCVGAAEKRYKRGDLMPIHNGCSCSVEEDLGDPPVVSDPAAAEAVSVCEHGEIGPVLTVRGQHFTSADDI